MNKPSGLLFADDFMGIAETGSELQCLIDIVHNWSKHWQFEVDINKCAVVVFPKPGKFWASGFGNIKAIPFLYLMLPRGRVLVVMG